MSAINGSSSFQRTMSMDACWRRATGRSPAISSPAESRSMSISSKRTVKRPEVPLVKHDPMKSLRAYIADSLCGLNASPLNHYETGLKEAFKEFARKLHPAGYHRDRSMCELIAGLRKPSTKCTMATLQHIKAVRSELADTFVGVAADPSDNQFLYGYEDAHWLLLGLVDPSMRATALCGLHSTLGGPRKRRETKQGLKSRTKSLLRAWPGRE
jgi:hypothetical protein